MSEQIFNEIVICDLDDTLIKHNSNGPNCVRADESFDFELYAQDFPNRKTIDEVLNLLNSLPETTYIILLTARNELIREETEEDLERRGVPYNELTMMPEDLADSMDESNYKGVQTTFKISMLNQLELDEIKVKLVIDDLIPFNVHCANQGISVLNPNSLI